ncbi:MAG: AAA family ATPase [Isosphaeraceae bacterium]
MLTRLDLEHFKCFELLKLPLSQLTLLAGANATGKSSAMQALVLMHQTILEHEWSSKLMLNGGELSLGTVTDVIDKITGRHTFSIGLVDDDTLVRWEFEGGDRKDMSATVARVQIEGNEYVPEFQMRHLFPVLDAKKSPSLAIRLLRLSYLTAERLGPREIYPLEDPSSVQVVGPRGEKAASLLHWGREETVLPKLVLPNAPPTRLRQVEARMQQFFPICSLEVQQVPQANAVTLGIRTSSATDYHRPVHVGFGLTQALPIFVAALSASPGDLLLVENPEAHLHPAGQAKMGVFLATVASAGVQVILETHSDHILNGVRRAVKTGVVQHHNVTCHYFKARDEAGDQVVSPLIDPNGNIDAWPNGFFDQFDRDANFFAGWGE